MKQKKALEGVDHDYIRYANVWEDARLLLEGLAPQAGARLLSIASGGDNALMLLTQNPELVVAADLNSAQLHLCALKIIAIKNLECTEYQRFVGFLPAKDRIHVYTRLRSQLDAPARAFWDEHQAEIEAGVVHAGKFERYFRMFAHQILPWIHKNKTVERLLEPKSDAEQVEFYQNHWNTWRWRTLFKLFFSKTVMGWLGRDPAFLDQVSVHVGDFIFNRAAHHLSTADCQDNFILRYNLSGNFGSLLPDYAHENAYRQIKNNLDALKLYQGFVETAAVPYGKFDGFNLSDIFEYLDLATFTQLGKALADAARPEARFCYWNLMVARNLHLILPEYFTDETALSSVLTEKDRGFFYQGCLVNVRR
ncbi:MAG: DUF3419 family protein [Bacteroidetes bacterium]|nr:DUF3419 family protein [Bacteroidota bacterium]